MNAEELKTLRAPIKERYKNDPTAAVVTLRAQGRIGEGIACRVDTGRALVEAGLHPASGGTGQQACSGDMLLEASSPKAISTFAARSACRRRRRSASARSVCASSSTPMRRRSS